MRSFIKSYDRRNLALNGAAKAPAVRAITSSLLIVSGMIWDQSGWKGSSKNRSLLGEILIFFSGVV